MSGKETFKGFQGEVEKSIFDSNFCLSKIVYPKGEADWHFHERPFIAFVLKGHMVEKNKRTELSCPPGSLLYQNWEEQNSHQCLVDGTLCIILELFDSNSKMKRGSFLFHDPSINILFHQLYKESKFYSETTNLEVSSLVSEISGVCYQKYDHEYKRLPWTSKLLDIIQDNYSSPLSLRWLAREIGIHPVYLSRAFRKEFNCTIGQFLRRVRVERSMILLYNSNLSLSEIAYSCGFADQSHYNRCFKQINNITPHQYRLILNI